MTPTTAPRPRPVVRHHGCRGRGLLLRGAAGWAGHTWCDWCYGDTMQAIGPRFAFATATQDMHVPLQ